MALAIGTICFVITVLAVTGNAVIMLISPETWFKLPPWFRFSGSLRPAKFRTGTGAIQVRILGGCVLGIMAWLLYAFIIGPR
jgi:hypothetical protein